MSGHIIMPGEEPTLSKPGVCAGCGCSDGDPCADGCTWLVAPTRDRDGICSSCFELSMRIGAIIQDDEAAATELVKSLQLIGIKWGGAVRQEKEG